MFGTRSAFVATVIGVSMAIRTVPADAIVDGHLTSRSAHPWFVDLGDECSGALVSPTRVVTSANCLNEQFLAAGAHLRIAHARRRVVGVAFSPGWVRHEAEFADLCRADRLCRFHGDFVGRYCRSEMPCPEDLAIIEIAKGVKGVPPLLIGSPHPGLRAKAFGDGDTTEDTFAPHDYRLRSADLVVLPDHACAAALQRTAAGSLAGLEAEGALCARASHGGAASLCYGDEGGPLARRTGRRWRLYGVASSHHRCGGDGSPSVYSDVRRYRSFVLKAKPVWRPRLRGEPRLVGVKAVDRTLSCTRPKASGRIDVTIYTFLGEQRAAVRQRGVRREYLVQAQDRGTSLACVVEVRNRGGFDQDSVTVDIAAGPSFGPIRAWAWPPIPRWRPGDEAASALVSTGAPITRAAH